MDESVEVPGTLLAGGQEDDAGEGPIWLGEAVVLVVRHVLRQLRLDLRAVLVGPVYLDEEAAFAPPAIGRDDADLREGVGLEGALPKSAQSMARTASWWTGCRRVASDEAFFWGTSQVVWCCSWWRPLRRMAVIWPGRNTSSAEARPHR
nr:hypothetical protein [Streptomyces cirratus]